MKRNVWIINHYASAMFFGKGGRHYWFAQYLKQNGYNPVIFCCNVKHGTSGKYFETNKLWVEKEAEEIGVPFIFVDSSMYDGNNFSRIKNMYWFYRNVQKAVKEYSAQNEKPDIIYASSVHPLSLVAGIQLAKRYRIKCICEMRDLWPEAIIAYSKKLNKNSLISKALYQGEKWIYKKADALIFTQEGGPDYVREHKWDTEHGGPVDLCKAYHINNGVDVEAFDENIKKYPYNDPELDDTSIYKVIYTGAIQRINNLGILLDAAKEITNPNIRLFVFGDGNERQTLEKRVADEKISNVVFKGAVAKYYIPSIVSRANLNLVHWEMNPLLRVGESYNKAFEYFAAGRPVFYTIHPGYSIVEKYQCGKLTEGFSPINIADGIQKMAEMSEEEKAEMSANARKTAWEYDFKNLTRKLIQIIEANN